MISPKQSDLITVFEDTTFWLPDYHEHEQNLYALRDIIGVNNFSLQTDGAFRIMHFVGFFQKGKTRLQVLPKVYCGSTTTQAEKVDALDFVYRMLSFSGFLRYKILKPQAVIASETDLLEIFINLFVTEFLHLFERKIFRSYETRTALQQFVKGRVMFSETLRISPILRHRHVVRFDEYSMNNSLNKLFKALLLQLMHQTNSRENRIKIIQGLAYLDDVDYVSLTTELFRSIKFNRLNTDFEPLFNLAKLFFYNHQPGMTEGREKTLSFLVPLNELFEHFVARLLSGCNDHRYTFHHQKHRLHLVSFEQDKEIQLRPDFTITLDDELVAIMDAKYKSPFGQHLKIDLKESDVYQMCAYALRYNVKQLFLIYPSFIGSVQGTRMLKEYTIVSGTSVIVLKAIQIDIFSKDPNQLSAQLKEQLQLKEDRA